jgi:hypothetical protein
MNIGDQRAPLAMLTYTLIVELYRLNFRLNRLPTFFMFCAIITGNIGVLCNKKDSCGSMQNTPQQMMWSSISKVKAQCQSDMKIYKRAAGGTGSGGGGLPGVHCHSASGAFRGHDAVH